MSRPDKHLYPSVHRGIVRAAVLLLGLEGHSAAERYSAGDTETLVEEAAAPDRIGDRQQGRGMHYYCAVRPDGSRYPLHPVLGGYCNGKGDPAPSPLTMMDAEYRASLALYRAGKHLPAMQSLSRALHMLADLCCPPHSCGLTYYSRYALAHKRYEARAAALFWKDSVDEPAAARRWAREALGSVPYDTYQHLLRGTVPVGNGTWQTGTLTQICNRIAESGAAELPAVLGSDDAARDASIRRRILLAIANSAAMLAAFDRDAANPALHVPEEQHPYWLCVPGASVSVSREPLYLHFADDGAVTLATRAGACLAVSRLGQVLLTDHTAGMVTRFRFGREPLLTLYPDGDQNRAVGLIRGQLHCIRRISHLQGNLFPSQISFVLTNRPPEHARYLF